MRQSSFYIRKNCNWNISGSPIYISCHVQIHILICLYNVFFWMSNGDLSFIWSEHRTILLIFHPPTCFTSMLLHHNKWNPRLSSFSKKNLNVNPDSSLPLTLQMLSIILFLAISISQTQSTLKSRPIDQ